VVQGRREKSGRERFYTAQQHWRGLHASDSASEEAQGDLYTMKWRVKGKKEDQQTVHDIHASTSTTSMLYQGICI